ncbi:MAG: DUF2868 domain-containing protein [Phycisphaera sp.]|nr:DUF2868 domain-containing protein [Phycisphaera sp.]
MNDVESSTTSIPEARTWRDRVARAAARETDDDFETIVAAKRIVDRGLLTAILGFAALAVTGGFAGWTATTELMRPAETPVHAPLLLSTIILVPWLLLLLRWLVFRLVGTRGGTILGRLVPFALVRGMGGGGHGSSPALGLAAGRQTARMLANGSGRRMATAAGALFWVSYGLLAIAAIWLSTARVAYGFGWESSWLSPSIGRTATSVLSAPISVLSLGPDVDSLVPVDPPPSAPANDADALATRREWIRFLSIGIGIYLVLPMGLLTIVNAAIGHWRAERWRPMPRPEETNRTTRTTVPSSPIVESTRSESPKSPAGRVTHLAALEEPLPRRDLPALLGGLEDLGSLDAGESATTVARTVDEANGRILVIAMLSTTPDRGVRRLLDAVRTTGTTPLVMLDGGDALRRAEPARTVAIRMEDWKQLLQELGFDWFECDLSSATATSLRLLEDAMAGGRDQPTAKPSVPIEDIHRLDEAFAVIGAHLPGDDSPSITLPSEEGLAACLLAVAESFETAGDGKSSWERRLQDVGRTLGHLSADPVSRLEALRTFGLDVIPEPLRTGALWAGIGGVLGVAACAAAATVAPAALVAMPGWAGTAAGLAGLISLARRGASSVATEDSKDAPRDETGSLGESVFVAATAAVLWWSQRGDEERTTRLLEILADDSQSIPTMMDADSARLWLSSTRTRLLRATEARS